MLMIIAEYENTNQTYLPIAMAANTDEAREIANQWILGQTEDDLAPERIMAWHQTMNGWEPLQEII
jgi:hypothetical protein